MNKKSLIIILIVIVVVILGIVFLKPSTTSEDDTMMMKDSDDTTEVIEGVIANIPVVTEEPTEENTTPTAIGDELEGIDLGDLEGELEDIDADLNSL